MIWDEFVWLCVNPTLGITEVSLIPTPDMKFIHPSDWLGDPYAQVIEVELEYDDDMRHPWVIGAITCVEVLKSCLGIRRFWLLTPHQLERYLRRRYGRRRETDQADGGRKSPVEGAVTQHQQAG
jgi:hypothetical protein